MKNKQSSHISYSREKNKVNIEGTGSEVKKMIFFDLISVRLLWIVITLLIAVALPQQDILGIILKWLKGWIFVY